MDDGEDFTPKLGKIGGREGRKVIRYGGRILAAVRLAGRKTGIAGRRFDGSRIGRGASLGRLLSSRDRLSGFRVRRAIVKTRLVRLGAKGLPGARAHLRYIQRDGVTREGNPGELYGPATDQADGRAFVEKSAGDRHQFRFIVSAEDGAEYPDLKPYIRRLMRQAEHDLGTKLDWVAVDHFNTDNPHTHVMLRGVDDRGENLIIAREYIAHGLRERAAELATLDLGPRTDREIEQRLRHDVEQERFTAIDRRLLHRMDHDRIVTAASRDPFQQSVNAGRLRKLGTMGLADDVGAGRWRLADGLDDTLRRLGEHGDIIRMMQRELTERNLDRRAGVARVIHADLAEPVVGRVIHRGFSDELHDRHFLMIDGVDGRVHHVDVGRAEAIQSVDEGSIVRLSRRLAEERPADRVIDDVARGNGGVYSVDAHLRHDRSASQDYAEAHVRRLEAMRRSGTGVAREADGSWAVGDDHLARAAAYEAGRVRAQPINVDKLSPVGPAALQRMDAATWLDRELQSGTTLPVRDAGFGKELRKAIVVRRQWLLEQDLAETAEAGFRLKRGALAVLKAREVRAEGARLALEMRKTYEPTGEGDLVEGYLRRRINLVSGQFAVVEQSREFTLVPWRPALERQLGNHVTGIMRSDGINWRFGRGKTGPSIT